MMQTQNAYNLKYENCRRVPSTGTGTGATASVKNISDNVSDIVDADYVDRNIPKMELLKINYVNKSLGNLAVAAEEPERMERPQMRDKRRLHQKPPAPRPHSDGALKISELAKLSNATHATAGRSMGTSSTTIRPVSHTMTTTTPTQHHHPLKYAVYKKHNEPSQRADKLQYTNDEDFFKSKRKYLVFDSKKRSGLDNIQFYFDSKSYERHVDNKMYGVISECDGGKGKGSDSASTGSSHSWNFIKSGKGSGAAASAGLKSATEQKIARKVPLPKSLTRESSLVDLSRIGKIFKETRSASSESILQRPEICVVGGVDRVDETAGSLKKIKKLESENGDHRCHCDHGSQTKHDEVTQIRVNETSNHKLHSQQIYAMPNNRAKTTSGHNQDKSTNMHAKEDARYLDQAHVTDCKITGGSEKSIVNIEYGKPKKAMAPPPPGKKTCGYKNCTFVNCPMSTPSASSDDAASHKHTKVSANENGHRKKTFHNISITKIDTISNKSKLYLKTKDFNEDDDMDDGVDGMASFAPVAVTLNNLRNLGLNTKGGSASDSANTTTTIPIKFTPNNQNLNNSIKCKSVDKPNFNSTTTSIEHRKFNNLSAMAPASLPSTPPANNKSHDTNRVKIFIRNPPSVTSGASSASSTSDSCSDYYDRVADSGSLTANECSSPDMHDSATKLTSHLRDLFPTRLGCDGAIFWNDCYYYDEHACCDCRSPELTNGSDGRKSSVNVLCSCDNNIKQVVSHFPFELFFWFASAIP